MIIWTQQGPFPNGETTKKMLDEKLSIINERIEKNHSKITIREFYEILGIKYGDTDYGLFEGELFVDPDDWGWDEKGFRRLYRTRTILEEL